MVRPLSLFSFPPVHAQVSTSWLSAARVLGTLALLSPAELGLSDFASNTPYFPRQIKSLSAVSAAQAQAVDVETGKTTGEIPRFTEMIEWYRSNLPDERKTGLRIVHCDYKLDNLVFHPTENRVIGILDWELCTLGSPVRLLLSFSTPYTKVSPLSSYAGPKLGVMLLCSSRIWQTSRNHGRLLPTAFQRAVRSQRLSKITRETRPSRSKSSSANTAALRVNRIPSRRWYLHVAGCSSG